jgi:hypothetical protein
MLFRAKKHILKFDYIVGVRLSVHGSAWPHWKAPGRFACRLCRNIPASLNRLAMQSKLYSAKRVFPGMSFHSNLRERIPNIRCRQINNAVSYSGGRHLFAELKLLISYFSVGNEVLGGI